MGVGTVKQAKAILEEFIQNYGCIPAQNQCSEFGFSNSQCLELEEVLSCPQYHVLTQKSKTRLEQAGFNKKFIQVFAGENGAKILRMRVRWLAENAVTRWYRIDFTKGERTILLNNLGRIGSIGPYASDSVPYLEEILGDEKEEEEVRFAAAQALGKMGSAALKAVPVMLEAIKPLPIGDLCCDWTLGSLVIKAFADLGPLAQRHIPELILKFRDRLFLSHEIFYAIDKMGPSAEEDLPILTQLLYDPSAEVRMGAAFAISLMGEKAWVVFSHLTNKLEDPSIPVRLFSVRALGQLGSKSAREEVLSKLVEFMEDDRGRDIFDKTEKEQLRKEVVIALGEMGPQAAKTMPVLIKEIEKIQDFSSGYHWSLFHNIENALNQMGPPPDEVIPNLVPFLRSPKENARFAVIEVLSKIDAKNSATPIIIGELRRLVDRDPSLRVRERAQAQLEKLQGEIR